MESCSNQKSVKQINIYFISFKVAALYLDDSLYNLGILSASFAWNALPTVLKEFTHILSTCWLLFLHSAVQLIPNHLNWVEVEGLWWPGQQMQHSITLLCYLTLTQLGGVLGHCPVEKQIIVPLCANQMDGVSLQIAVVAMLVKCALNSKNITDSVTSKAPPHHHTSSSMLHGRNHTCGDHPFTYSASHKDTAVGPKNFKFGLIRPKDRFPPV